MSRNYNVNICLDRLKQVLGPNINSQTDILAELTKAMNDARKPHLKFIARDFLEMGPCLPFINEVLHRLQRDLVLQKAYKINKDIIYNDAYISRSGLQFFDTKLDLIEWKVILDIIAKGPNPFPSLNFTNCGITVAHIVPLCELLVTNQIVITHLILGQVSMSNDFAKVLSQCLSNIKTLGINNSDISDEGVIILAEGLAHTNIMLALMLVNDRIGDEGAKALANALLRNQSLQKLYLNNNVIGDDGAIVLSKALQQNKSINIFQLNNNNIGFRGMMAFANILPYNTTLQHIFFLGNQFSGNMREEDIILYTFVQALRINQDIKSITLYFGTDVRQQEIQKQLDRSRHQMMVDPTMSTRVNAKRILEDDEEDIEEISLVPRSRLHVKKRPVQKKQRYHDDSDSEDEMIIF